MTTSRIATLFLFVTVGLGSIFLLPKYKEQPTGIILELPNYLGQWEGTDAEVSQKEKSVLGKGTEFARKTFENPYLRIKGYPLTASIVLSGSDMSTSIHRPERCLLAQGWNIQNKEEKTITLPDKGTFPIMRLHNHRMVEHNGKTIDLKNVTCYWFAGSDEVTAGHWERWAIDNRDRLLKGVSQRWAFITISGVVPPVKPEHEAEAIKWTEDNILQFITALAPKIHGDSIRY